MRKYISIGAAMMMGVVVAGDPTAQAGFLADFQETKPQLYESQLVRAESPSLVEKLVEAGDLALAATEPKKEKLEQILGGDTLTTQYTRLHDIPVTDIDGNQLTTIGSILGGKKAILVINVAPL
jgi:hypothetical protein